MSAVSLRKLGDIAVIEVNNPPVNALSLHVRQDMAKIMTEMNNDSTVSAIVLTGHRVFLGGADITEFPSGKSRICNFRVRRGIAENIEAAEKDHKIKAIVITGHSTFIAGADITEFKDGSYFEYPRISDVTHVIEDCQKPVVAAISGFALGGGLEIAISCHYRVVHEGAKFGFPEVDIGILPAATGTQRFPRLVGLGPALQYIPSGQRFSAATALKMGAVDKVVKGDPVKDAIAFAKSIAHKSLNKRRTSKMSVKGTENAVALRDAAIQRTNLKQRGMIAPLFCIKAVLAATEYPFEEGLEKEQEFAIILFGSGQARALQYAFFALRAAPKWEIPGGKGNWKTVKPTSLSSGGVIGAGTMGSGIAMAMLNAGMSVVLLEQNQKLLDAGVSSIRGLYEGSVRLGRLTKAQVQSNLNRLTTSVNYDALRDVDIVVEAAFEKMSLKKEIFAKLDKICSSRTLLCSNTSSLSITEIASATSRPDRVAGTHFFVPAYHMQLLENIRGDLTSPQTIASVMKFGTQLGKTPVLVGNCTHFAANRMRGPHVTEAVYLVEEGCLPEEVDQVAEDFGLPLGPLKIGDLSGLDIGVLIKGEVAKKMGVKIDLNRRSMNSFRTSHLIDLLVKHDRKGRKTGAGWYKYDAPGAKEAHPDAFVKELVLEYSRQHGIVRRRIPYQEILERMMYSSINEGFKILEEGICNKPEDLDAIWLLGFGWPRHYGGPMFYCSTVGLKTVYNRICHYYQQDPISVHWQPADFLTVLASQESEIPFSQWMKYKPNAGTAAHL